MNTPDNTQAHGSNLLTTALMFIFTVVVLSLGLSQSAHAAGVKTSKVHVVHYQNGGRPASYRRIAHKTWEERGPRGAKRIFKETHRDAWSIYLYDAPQKTKLQLDLYRKKVTYSDSNNPTPRDLYNITSAAALNGYSVEFVKYGNVTLTNTHGKQWVGRGNGRTTYYTEARRTRDIVSLQYPGRHGYTVINMGSKTVGFFMNGHELSTSRISQAR